jgi:hypothetical protein
MSYLSLKKILVVPFLAIFSCAIFANEPPETVKGKTVHEVYMQLLESTNTLRAYEVRANDTAAPITFGGEKEGSSHLITRVAGPSGESLIVWVTMSNQKKAFYREFLKRFVSGRSRLRTVVDVNGVDVSLTTEELSRVRGDFDSMTKSQLKERFEIFIEITKDRPFSYLTRAERKALFKGTAPHLVGGVGPNTSIGGLWYSVYTPNFGEPERHIDRMEGTSKGWEIVFKPMPTYGDFEAQILWFRNELKNTGKLFQAPGHQRIVFPNEKALKVPAAKRQLFKGQLNELIRMSQAYIILRGIKGQTGIENSNYKMVLKDSRIRVGGSTGRGVLRLDYPNKFVPETYSLELRAGTKDEDLRRFLEHTITARVATKTLGDLSTIGSYALYETIATPRTIKSRFGVSFKVAKLYHKNIRLAYPQSAYNVAMWKWENAPFLEGKRDVIRWATINHIEEVSRATTPEEIKKSVRDWIKITDITRYVEEYLRPQRVVRLNEKLHRIPARPNGVNVNRIDLGIEYSARFGNKYFVEMAPQLGADGNPIWLNTRVGMTPYERKEKIREMAINLGIELNGRRVPVVDASTAGAHGHGLSIAYKVKDPQGRSWRCEWDGVGRDYNSRGEVIPESMRGGHVEIVTPKFVPKAKEIRSVYKAMEKTGLLPGVAGGGHINIDLKPFEGKPRELSRFLTLFHENRNVISFMFQNLNRGHAAEALEVTPRLARELKGFNGSELELKRLLYNERYFNQRIGRKTRNVQIDMSAYFQDIIPAKHIHVDFDMKNPHDPWRPQFRVEPHIRKMEMRMFDAPLDHFESAMQMKLVRALLDTALNGTEGLSGNIKGFEYEKMAGDYEYATRELERMCRQIGLEAGEFKFFLAKAYAQANITLSSPLYKSFAQKAAEKGLHIIEGVWDSALQRERPASKAIRTTGRTWRSVTTPEAQEFLERRVEAVREAEELRLDHTPSANTRRALRIGVNCKIVFSN